MNDCLELIGVQQDGSLVFVSMGESFIPFGGFINEFCRYKYNKTGGNREHIKLCNKKYYLVQRLFKLPPMKHLLVDKMVIDAINYLIQENRSPEIIQQCVKLLLQHSCNPEIRYVKWLGTKKKS